MKYKIGLIGCGYVGKKRAGALENIAQAKLVRVADTNPARARELASKYKCEHGTDWKEVTRDNEINVVMVSTTNNMLAEITMDALKQGKHVLVEKPGARNPAELRKIIDVYEGMDKKFKIKVGFNHRFHPSISKAKEIIMNENIGDVMFIRARYGHGGRPGYEREWRARRDIAGGGEMLDQGSHIIDLSRHFLGDFQDVFGYCGTFFWDMEVEDNCFALLRTKKGQIAQLHASCTHWKNMFSFEIFCSTGQISIDGLQGSYGKETLTFFKMKPEMGVPDRFVFSWNGPDLSFEHEIKDFIRSIESNEEPNGNIYDAYECIKLVYRIYESGKRRDKKIKKIK
jgi:predicted dehydrogenase